jgi:hypothetical protein
MGAIDRSHGTNESAGAESSGEAGAPGHD